MMPRRKFCIKRGQYKPGLQPDLAVASMWGLVVINLIRGADYSTGENPGESLTLVELALPIEVWGWIFLTAAVAMGYGLWTRRFRPVIFSSVISMSAYITLAVGAAVNAMETLMRFGWPPDRFRDVGVYAFFALLSGCYAYGAVLKQAAVRSESSLKEE